MGKPANLDNLEHALGYRFRNRGLLLEAMVHSSCIGDQPMQPVSTNERLEFLGDAVIHLVVSEALYSEHPDWDEGVLTRVRSALVARTTMAEVGRALQLGRYLRLGRGEAASGGRHRASNLADAFEAICGAAYLDGGFEAASAVVQRHLLAGREGWDGRDPKTALQEALQARGYETPVYHTVACAGPDHSPEFASEVRSGGILLGRGTGTPKKAAERAAAVQALERIERGEV